MARRKVAVVTGSRADYGLLYCLLKALQHEPSLELALIVCGAHLSAQFGNTVDQIEHDGFSIAARVEMLLSSDTACGVAKSIGVGVIGFADALARMNPDLLLVLGDRYEILAAVQAALIANIPVAHVAGGDVTEGAYDEAIRHSITKMSHLHFVTNEQSRARVIQLGESPDRVFLVGHTGLDMIKRTPTLPKQELEMRLDFRFRKKNLLVTFHPATLEVESACSQISEVTAALESLGEDFGVIFTRPNADTEGLGLSRAIDAFVGSHPNCKVYSSLGPLLYLNVMRKVDAIVGNSSSGIYEAPSFGKPTVNVGNRQRGRLQAASVLNCVPERSSIRACIESALSLDCSCVTNPYGDGESSSRIVTTLSQLRNLHALIEKRFFDVPHQY